LIGEVSTFKLREWTSCGGCAAKWGGSDLSALLGELAVAVEDDLLVGLAPFDDAAVYRLGPEVALVSTTDFFPPLVDDPDDFGAIAAANACSDVYAMGGQVLLALNIAAFPEQFPPDVIATILRAAAQTVAAAGGRVAGGHTIRSGEPIFGLAVQGLVHPDRIWTKQGARPGDVLLLSKPLGSGIVLASDDEKAKASTITIMRELNRRAAEQLALLPSNRGSSSIHAVTDVTGFGLAGHAWEIADRSRVQIQLESSRLPLYSGALLAADSGVRTGGDVRNRSYLGERFHSDAPASLEALCIDPQTSGGLLASITPASAAVLIDDGWWQVGEVLEGIPIVELR
jgi:selenide,water dikinase